MIKSKKLTGMKVVDMKTGKVLGRIKDALFLPGDKKIKWFTVECPGWFRNKKALPVENIKHIGSNVVIYGTDGLQEIIKDSAIFKASDKKELIFGRKVISSDGEDLGYIDDIIFDERDFSIEGYVLTDGIIEDIINGKSVILNDRSITFGEDMVILNGRCNDVMLKNHISIKKFLKRQGKPKPNDENHKQG